MNKEFILLKNEYNKETNTAYITINTPIGAFTGKAKCHPEDKPSEYYGYELAETRARIKYFKRLRKDAEIKLNELKAFYEECYIKESLFDSHSFYMNKLRKRIDKVKGEIKKINVIIDAYKQLCLGAHD